MKVLRNVLVTVVSEPVELCSNHILLLLRLAKVKNIAVLVVKRLVVVPNLFSNNQIQIVSCNTYHRGKLLSRYGLFC